MKKTYNWVTPKGAKVEFTVNSENVKSEIINADGHKIEVACDKYTYAYELKVNGSLINYKIRVYEYQNVNAIEYGKQGINTLFIAIPDNIYNDIYGEENAKIATKIKKIVASAQKYGEHCEMMKRAMAE